MNTFQFILFTLAICILSTSCSEAYRLQKEVEEDEKEYKYTLTLRDQIEHSVSAKVETTPVEVASVHDDAADDPAVWLNKRDPAQSVIYGSHKKGGIYAYGLDGSEQQFIPCGNINNIDVRQQVQVGGDRFQDVIGGSNRSDNSLLFYFIDSLGNVLPNNEYRLPLGRYIPYGFCLYKTETSELQALVNDKNGEVRQYHLSFEENATLTHKLVRTLQFDSQLEGMVVDDERHLLYIGEEEKGIFSVSARADNLDKPILLRGSTEQNNQIKYDIEGLSLMKVGERSILIASSQGNFSYAMYDALELSYLISFTIRGDSIDDVEETDGLDVLQYPLNPDYPNGILVAQDGFNFDGNEKQNQNFKIVNLTELIQLLVH